MLPELAWLDPLGYVYIYKSQYIQVLKAKIHPTQSACGDGLIQLIQLYKSWAISLLPN